MRRYSWMLPAVAALALAGVASADVKVATDVPGLATGPNCDLSGYKSETTTLSPPFAIPDNGRVQVQVGGLLPTANDGSVLTDVILEVNMAHTWVGDLVLRLEYVDCATLTPLYGTNVLCRPRGTNTTTNTPCGSGTGVGCSADLVAGNVYRFADAAPAPMADGTCTNPIASGCYKPSPGGAMVGFVGLVKGKCWRLTVSDWASLDTGIINSWTVWEQNQTPVGAKAGTWGQLKTLYR